MKHKRFEVNDFCCLLDNDSDSTVIIFSAANTKRGKFSFYKSGIKSSYNILFLNTQHNDWYLSGVPELGASLEQTLVEIQKLLSMLNKSQKKVITWGGSMGAFAAIHYGSLLKEVTHVFAFGPELELGIEHGKAHKFIDKSKKINIYNLIANNSKDYQIYCGANDYMDMIGLTKLSNMSISHVHTYAIDGVNHALAPYVERKFGLNHVITTYLDNNINVLSIENRKDLIYDELLYQKLYELMYLKKDITLQFDLNYENDMHNLLAFFLNRKSFKDAINYINKAIEISKHNTFFHHKKILYLYNKNEVFDSAVNELAKNFNSFYYYDTQCHQFLEKIISMSLEKKYYKNIVKLYNNIDEPFLFLDTYTYIVSLENEIKRLKS